MSSATIFHDARLTDSIERDLVRHAYEQPAQARPLLAAANTLRALGRAAKTFIGYLGAIGEGMNDARRASARNTGSQW